MCHKIIHDVKFSGGALLPARPEFKCETHKPLFFIVILFYANKAIRAHFLTGVLVQQIETQTVWVATPLRALIDYVIWHKIDNADMQFLNTSLRIEAEHLDTIKKEYIEKLSTIYKSKRVAQFLKA